MILKIRRIMKDIINKLSQKKRTKKIYLAVLLSILLISASAGCAYYFGAKSLGAMFNTRNKGGDQVNTAGLSDEASSINKADGNSNSQLEKDLQNIDAKFKAIDDSFNSIDESVNDNQTDLN